MATDARTGRRGAVPSARRAEGRTLHRDVQYYYDEKASYLAALSEAGAGGHDLTSFLRFGLKGIATQCNRLLAEIRTHVSKSLFRDMMYDLFNRLKSTRRRVIAERQIELLKSFWRSIPSIIRHCSRGRRRPTPN